MNIKLIFPTTEETQKKLQDHIDTLHCHLIFSSLNDLDLDYEEKLLLLEETKKQLAIKDYDPRWMSNYPH